MSALGRQRSKPDIVARNEGVVRFKTILPCKGRWMAEGQTEGCPPLDRTTPLHHFVVPFGRVACLCRTLQGRILPPQMVVSALPLHPHALARVSVA